MHIEKRPKTRDNADEINFLMKKKPKPYHEFLKQHKIETCNNWRQINVSPGPAAAYHIPGIFEKYPNNDNVSSYSKFMTIQQQSDPEKDKDTSILF